MRVVLAYTGMKKVTLVKGLAIFGALLAVVLFFVLRRADNTTVSDGTGGQVISFQWKDEFKSARKALRETFPDIDLEERSSMRIEQEDDVTGDGIPEALISLGTGGASTDFYALVRMTENGPESVQFRTEDGSVEALTLLQGGSVTHSDAVLLDPERHAVSTASVMRSGEDGRIDSCVVDTYIWNEKDELFTYSVTESRRTQNDFCTKQLSYNN